MNGSRQTGTVKMYDRDRGFGFIQCDGDYPDLFVHTTDLRRSKIFTLEVGERVSFEVIEHERGLRATNVIRRDSR